MSDRDTLTNLLLDCMETSASPRETAEYLIERGVRAPAPGIADAAQLSALPADSIVLNTTTKVAWQRTRNLSWMSMTGLSDSRELFHAPGHLVLIYIPTKEVCRG